jgi:hypothetical protein
MQFIKFVNTSFHRVQFMIDGIIYSVARGADVSIEAHRAAVARAAGLTEVKS